MVQACVSLAAITTLCCLGSVLKVYSQAVPSSGGSAASRRVPAEPSDAGGITSAPAGYGSSSEVGLAASTLSGISAYSLALQLGLGEVAELIRENGGAKPITEEEEFIAACARGDEAEARRIRFTRPDLPRSLPEARQRLLPDWAAMRVRDSWSSSVGRSRCVAVTGKRPHSISPSFAAMSH
jgi:hypothetical protein